MVPPITPQNMQICSMGKAMEPEKNVFVSICQSPQIKNLIDEEQMIYSLEIPQSLLNQWIIKPWISLVTSNDPILACHLVERHSKDIFTGKKSWCLLTVNEWLQFFINPTKIFDISMFSHTHVDKLLACLVFLPVCCLFLSISLIGSYICQMGYFF